MKRGDDGRKTLGGCVGGARVHERAPADAAAEKNQVAHPQHIDSRNEAADVLRP